MLSEKIESALNKQLETEAASSQIYLAMASWAESQGLNGIANFLYTHSDEERAHMMKLLRFINERGGHGIVPKLDAPKKDWGSVRNVFEQLLAHEVKVTQEINSVVHICLEEKDYTTHNFMQWYVQEQIEEEALARTIMDKLNLIGDDNPGLYMFDRDLENFSAVKE